MKKFVKIFALAALMIMGGQAMAQNSRGAFFLSASFPLKDYADFDGFGDFALTSYNLDDDDAGAGIGFNAGLKWYFNMGVQGLGAMLSLDGFYNGPNSNLQDAYKNGEASFGNQFIGGSFKYESTPKYINVPAMLGLNYIFFFNSNLGLYIEAGAGGNFRFITDMEGITQANLGPFAAQTKITNNYESAFTFAYQVGAGFQVARKLVIGCSFYDLGKAGVKGERIAKTNSSTPSTNETWGTVHPIMILARIGFCF